MEKTIEYCGRCGNYKPFKSFSMAVKSTTGRPICNTCHQRMIAAASKTEKQRSKNSTQATKVLRGNLDQYMKRTLFGTIPD